MHFLNVILSGLLESYGSPCAWYVTPNTNSFHGLTFIYRYLVIFLLDIFVGTFLSFAFVIAAVKIAQDCFQSHDLDSGYYGDPPRWLAYLLALFLSFFNCTAGLYGHFKYVFGFSLSL